MSLSASLSLTSSRLGLRSAAAMDQAQRLHVLVLLVLAAAVGGARGNALVSGFVMCDHCRDGQITLFDYPLAGTVGSRY